MTPKGARGKRKMNSTPKENKAFAKNLAIREAVETARSLSVELATAVAVAYDSTSCKHANEAVALDKCCVVVVDDCELGQPYRWGDFVWDNGKKVV
jgi:hypothetical protein